VTDADDSPHLAIAGSTAAYVFGHADQDPGMTLEHVAVLEEALQEAGRPHLNEVYAGAAHGYTMADTSVYDEAGTERHFAELRALLDRTL
jgi:carboxymethylenebutenolidase